MEPEVRKMEPEVRKAMLPLLILPVVYVGLVFVIWYSIDNDIPILAVAYAAFAFTAVALALRNFLNKTALKQKRPYAPFRTVNADEPDDGKETRRVTVTLSGYVTRGKVKLLADDAEVAELEGGDRIRMYLTAGPHTLSAKEAQTSFRRSIPEDGDLNFYIWYNRSAKTPADVMQIDDVTKGMGDLEAKDTASYNKIKMIFNMTYILTPVIGTIAVAVALFT